MYTGLVGALKTENAFGEFTDIAYISGWSVDEKAEMIDCSEFGSADKNSIAGAKSWSASADGTICFNKVGGYDELFEAYCLGKPISFHFHLSDGNIEGKENTYLCGSGYIESISVKLSSGDIGTASVSVAGVGPLEMFVNDKTLCRTERTGSTPLLRFTSAAMGICMPRSPIIWTTARCGWTKARGGSTSKYKTEDILSWQKLWI